MKPHRVRKALLPTLGIAALLTVLNACGDDVPLGTKSLDAALPGTGGGTSLGGSMADAAFGTGGALGGGGGTVVADAPIATGGVVTRTGGQIGSGGVPGTGGRVGSGGATSTGGSTGRVCGTIAGLACSAGEFCDFTPPGCGRVPDGDGICRPTGAGLGCIASYDPVCGCDGKTYPNDCERMVAGVPKLADGACGGGTGGRTGTGGIIMDGGAPGSGGRTGSGGIIMDGGAPGSGGMTGKGGATGFGGSDQCGGPSSVTCSPGMFCDLASDCGQVADAIGKCVLSGPNVVCGASYAPVCGCDGKTYSNDCVRAAAGMLKASDGACAPRDGGAQAYPTAYLAWQAPGGIAGVGPAIVVSGKGWAVAWQRTYAFSPETPPSDPAESHTLTSEQTDDLFARLAAINMSSLPHDYATHSECYPNVYFRFCEGCTATTLKYGEPPQIAPEFDPVWVWFDQLLGSSSLTHPYTYCNWDL